MSVRAWRSAAADRRRSAAPAAGRRAVPPVLTAAAVPGLLPRAAPPAAPAAHHGHGRVDVQRLLPVRLVDALAAVVARARRGPALHHLPARPARRERDVEHPGPRAGRAVLAGHAHCRPGRRLQRRDDPRARGLRARARPRPGRVDRAVVAARRRRAAVRVLPVRDRAQLRRAPQPGVGGAAAGAALGACTRCSSRRTRARGAPARWPASRSPCRPGIYTQTVALCAVVLVVVALVLAVRFPRQVARPRPRGAARRGGLPRDLRRAVRVPAVPPARRAGPARARRSASRRRRTRTRRTCWSRRRSPSSRRGSRRSPPSCTPTRASRAGTSASRCSR